MVGPGIQLGVVFCIFRQRGNDAIDAVGTIAVRIDVGEAEFDLAITSNIFKCRNSIPLRKHSKEK